MKYIKPLYERDAESKNFEESGLEGVSAKDILMHIYADTFVKVLHDMDKQCDESAEYKSKHIEMLRSSLTFYVKYHGSKSSKSVRHMLKKYNME
jgi:hypothetical protein